MSWVLELFFREICGLESSHYLKTYFYKIRSCHYNCITNSKINIGTFPKGCYIRVSTWDWFWAIKSCNSSTWLLISQVHCWDNIRSEKPFDKACVIYLWINNWSSCLFSAGWSYSYWFDSNVLCLITIKGQSKLTHIAMPLDILWLWSFEYLS